MYCYQCVKSFLREKSFMVALSKINCVKTFVLVCHMFYPNNFLFFQFHDKTFVLFIKPQNFSYVWYTHSYTSYR